MSRIIYTPSDFARDSLLHIQETGELRAQSQHQSARRGLASFLFFVVESGQGRLTYGGTVYPLAAGDCVFIDCREPYAHETSAELWHLRWVHFAGPCMDSIYAKYAARGGMPAFHTEWADAYAQILMDIERVAQSSSYVRDMELQARLSELLVLLMQDAWQGEAERHPSPKKQEMAAVKEYLDRHYREALTLDELAGQFFINKYYLAKLFRAAYGLTIHEYLVRTRITEAKRLLRYSDLSMEQISGTVGLGSANYLARTFRQVEGMSPREYRKKW